MRKALNVLLYDNRHFLPAYYAILCTVLLGLPALGLLLTGEPIALMSGGVAAVGVFTSIKSASCITLFVTGLNLCKEYFRYYLISGFSRRSYFLAVCAFILWINLAVLLLDLSVGYLFTWVYNLIAPIPGNVGHVMPGLGTQLSCFAVTLALTSFGYLITTSFYRAGKLAKGLLIAALVVLGYFALEYLSQDEIELPLRTLLGYLSLGIPVAALFLGGSWLLLRRMDLK